ncbi:MAG: hypothetical protein QM775_16455 [Pirellulales bacterium]
MMRMDGWTWEDMTVRADAAMVVEWPVLIQTQTARLEQTRIREEKRAKALEQMTNLFADARAYQKMKQTRRDQGGPPPAFDALRKRCCRCSKGRRRCTCGPTTCDRFNRPWRSREKEGVRLVIVGGYHARNVGATACRERERRRQGNAPLAALSQRPVRHAVLSAREALQGRHQVLHQRQ